DLGHLCSQRVAIVGISCEALRADEPSSTTTYRDTHLVSKLILLARLALGDALHFRFMHTVDLVLVMPLLCMDLMRFRKQPCKFVGWRFNLAFYLANDAPQLRFQLARAGTSAFHLTSMGIAAGLHQQAAAKVLITLLDREALSSCGLHQALTHALIESGIGGETNGLGLNCRVHVDALQLSRANHAHHDACFNRRTQHLLGSGIAQPLAPTRHARWIDRHLMLKMPHAAEVLPVGIFNPRGNHVFIAQIELVFQIVQGNHQPRRDAGRTMAGMISIAKSLLERRPIDAKTKTNQRMAQVDQLLQIYLKHLPLWLLRLALGSHRFSPVSRPFAKPSGKF